MWLHKTNGVLQKLINQSKEGKYYFRASLNTNKHQN